MSSLAVLFMGMSIVFLLVFVVVWAIDVAGNYVRVYVPWHIF